MNPLRQFALLASSAALCLAFAPGCGPKKPNGTNPPTTPVAVAATAVQPVTVARLVTAAPVMAARPEATAVRRGTEARRPRAARPKPAIPRCCSRPRCSCVRPRAWSSFPMTATRRSPRRRCRAASSRRATPRSSASTCWSSRTTRRRACPARSTSSSRPSSSRATPAARTSASSTRTRARAKSTSAWEFPAQGGNPASTLYIAAAVRTGKTVPPIGQDRQRLHRGLRDHPGRVRPARAHLHRERQEPLHRPARVTSTRGQLGDVVRLAPARPAASSRRPAAVFRLRPPDRSAKKRPRSLGRPFPTPSSSGLGLRPFTPATRVRTPLGSQTAERALFVHAWPSSRSRARSSVGRAADF